MIAVIQRVSKARVEIDKQNKAEIGEGLLILLGITHDDSAEDIEWLSSKIVNLRIFDDENGVMNLSCLDKKADIIVVSQFTLHARTKKGNRPSYIDAARPEQAIPLYESFIKHTENLIEKSVQSGVFGANMLVELCNTGPVTIIIDSKNRI
ncbi:MAG: D-aminoacyl-tRNA deacylase [Bacteroidales bacterium]|nr:D-aminoacyl-tRNA deacylase [Bacteroidales bacterium]